jgi:hypothetical protein
MSSYRWIYGRDLLSGAKLPSVRAADEAGILVGERLGALPADGDAGSGGDGGQTSGKRQGPGPSRPAHAISRPRWTLADTSIVIGLIAVGVALPAAIALWSHAFGIPRYDDWAYRRVLSDFVLTGHMSLVGWGAMTLVGQILWAAPFAAVLGAQAWVAGFSVAIASAIGIGCAYWLARSLVGRGWGVACTLLVLVAPGFLVNTSSFMTDVPAFSAEIVCLALGVAALRARGRARWALLAASMAVGCAGFSVREFDLAAPTAVLVSLALQDRRNWRTYTAFGACVLALCTAIYLWTWQLAGAQHEALGLPIGSALRALAGGYFALALFVSPFLPAAVRRSGPARSRRGLIAAAVILVTGVVLLASGRSIFSGNYLTQQGMSGTATLPGFRPVLFPAPVWLVLQFIALAAGTVLAFMAANASCGVLRSWSTGRDGERSIISIFVALSGIGLVVYGLFVQGPIFDRYVWALAFATAVLLARTALDAEATSVEGARPGAIHEWAASRGTPVLAATVGLALVATAVAAAVTLNADAYDGARWSAGQAAVRVGFPASAVDAGFDWVGWHAATPAERGLNMTSGPPYELWYDQMFPRFKECAFVSGSPVASADVFLLGTVRYQEVGFAVPEYLYIYGVRDQECAPVRHPSHR